MYDNTLEKEWNKLLTCTIDQNLFDEHTSYDKKKELFKRYIKIINLETFSYCNKKYSYSPISLIDNKNNTYLTNSHLNMVIQNLKEINYSNTISLNLHNEPLPDKSILKTISKLRNTLPNANIFFNSNGDYLTKEILNKLSNVGLNSIHITLHTLPKKTYDDKNSLSKIEKFYSKLKIYYTINSKKENQFIRTSFAYNNLVVSIETTNYDRYGKYRAGSVDKLVENKKRTWPCARPYREFTLFSNGRIYPRYQIFAPLDDNENSMGSLDNYNSIFELNTSNKLSKLRQHLYGYGEKKSPCNKCTETFLYKERTKLA